MDVRELAYELGKGVSDAIDAFCSDDKRFEELCRIRAICQPRAHGEREARADE